MGLCSTEYIQSRVHLAQASTRSKIEDNCKVHGTLQTRTQSSECIIEIEAVALKIKLIMASLFRLAGHFIRTRSTVATATKYLRRGLLVDVIDALDDILLHKDDFPPLESDYLALVKKKYFLDKYGIG